MRKTESDQKVSISSKLPYRAKGKGKLLGEWAPVPLAFPGIGRVIDELTLKEHFDQPEKSRFEQVNHALLVLIQETQAPCFLLPAVIDFIDRVNAAKIIDRYTMVSFELFLNLFAKLSPEENYRIRAKIVGKDIPREQYQNLFPVGMNKVFPGTHFVTAHSSPDLDTTVASFWGWVDAFGCRVSEGLHIWNVPGGPPEGQVEIELLFKQIFGDRMFQYLAKTKSALSVSALDLMTQKGMIRKGVRDSTEEIDLERDQHAIVLVDERGYYLGDWRNFDREGVQQVILLLSNCLRWFENHLQMKFLSFFAKHSPSVKDISPFIKEVFGVRICDCQTAKDFSKNQKESLQAFLVKVLGVSHGLNSTFGEFAYAMKELSLFDFQEFMQLVESLQDSQLFDRSGSLIENRPHIFHYLEKMISGLDRAIQTVRTYVDRLDIALQIKMQVLNYQTQYASSRADIEEIRSKIGAYPYLTVTASDRFGNRFPLGIVSANEVYRPILGTVTLRDFCNRDETKIPSYLEVISVIDHHKASLQTSTPPVVTISDAQSSNGMIAEIAFEMNNAFSTGGMSKEEVQAQLDEEIKDLSHASKKRIVQRLLQKLLVFDRGAAWFIAPEREYVEYLHFLYAILDDTDLLTKASMRDFESIASLLNRLKSLSLGRETEIVHFDDLARDNGFIAKAARRLLQNDDLYSLYSMIYHAKEETVAQNIVFCAEGKSSTFFADTKEQNGCCRVGQTKMFVKNFPVFEKHVDAIRRIWLEEAMLLYKDRHEYDLHLHMVSTLAGADDLHKGLVDHFKHKDELWIWIPFADSAIEHLKSFLNAFRSLPGLQLPETEIEFLGPNAEDLDLIFKESFLPNVRRVQASKGKHNLPIAVLRYKAGAINSRKAQVSPFLPKLIS